MGVMKRLSKLLESKAEKVLAEIEDPRETLDYSYQQQLELLTHLQRSAADAVASRKRLESQMTTLSEQQAELARQAELAPSTDWGREALLRKKSVDHELSDLASRYEALQADEEQLRSAHERLKAKVDAFRTQKETIKAKYTAAETQARVSEAWAGISREVNQADISRISCERQRELLTDLWCNAKAIAAARARLDRQMDTLLRQQAELEDQARRALDANQEDVAQGATAQKEEIDRQLPDLVEMLYSLQADEEELTTAYHKLAVKVETSRLRIGATATSQPASDTAVGIGKPADMPKETYAVETEESDDPAEDED